MKTKAWVWVAVFLVVFLAGVCSFAVDKNKYGFYEPSPNEVTFGTWVNTEYSGAPYRAQKFVDYRWGSYDIFMLATNKTPDYKGSATIVDKWTDAEGNTWYKNYNREDWTPEGMFALIKINKDGNVKEFVWNYKDFPTEDDLRSKNVYFNYRIFYLQGSSTRPASPLGSLLRCRSRSSSITLRTSMPSSAPYVSAQRAS